MRCIYISYYSFSDCFFLGRTHPPKDSNGQDSRLFLSLFFLKILYVNNFQLFNFDRRSFNLITKIAPALDNLELSYHSQISAHPTT